MMPILQERKVSIRALLPPSSRSNKCIDIHKRVMDLSSKRNWKTLRAFLAGKDVFATSNSLLMSREGSGETALHAACRNDPPLDVIQMIAAAFPAAVVQVDADKRTPLHVAAALGASPQVIIRLLELDSKAASMQDARGKTPIISWCEKCCFGAAFLPGDFDLSQDFVESQVIEVVKALCKASPTAVNMPDEEEMTALEYAIVAGAGQEVVRTLQWASVKAWKAKRKMEMAKERRSALQSSSLSELHKGVDRPSQFQDSSTIKSSKEQLHSKENVAKQSALLRDLMMLLSGTTQKDNKQQPQRLSFRRGCVQHERKTSMPTAA